MKLSEICRNVSLNAFKEGDILKCVRNSFLKDIKAGMDYKFMGIQNNWIRVSKMNGAVINNGFHPHFFHKI